ncbi:Di-heme cytochrome c peroxidase [Aquisphaera giovannonii]|uniref:Di-heme cytochrome c peroxidase n=1 Tax=Aquisphaera giovannonii TaxID=406548 RepID=A0A5B9W4L9_9BACT|nr:cytochrome c peroxidase [Aquisphaera giovannonii]QEH35021.1 Di-heme cytochrome c peroxidase [Aquisphaera giovannonii]
MTTAVKNGMPALGLVLATVAIASGGSAAEDHATGEAPAARARRPVALALSGDGAALLVANGRSGTISEIDVPSATRVAEHPVARALGDLAPLGDGLRFAAVDPEAGELLLLEHRAGRLAVKARLGVGPDPIRVAILPGGQACAVASRWGRRLAIVDIGPGGGEGALRLRRSIDLLFPPREVLPLREGKALLVADAFGGRLAVVDPAGGTIASVREVPGHNLRGLAIADGGAAVVLARQLSSRLATSSFDDVHWGDLMKNQVLSLRADAILDPAADILRGSSSRDLDEVGHAAGDPEDLAIDPKGRIVVALAGVGEVAVLGDRASPIVRVPAGTRPSAVVVDSRRDLAFVADVEEDSVAIVPLGGGAGRVASLGPRPGPTAIERGERLFNSARLSHHGWMSCRSCHAEGHTGGFAVDTFGDKSYGAPKLVPSLLGAGATGPWGWLGNFGTLEDQARFSIETTMRGKPLDDGDVADLAAYVRSLRPPPPPAAPREAADRGALVFRSKKCANCHAGEALTSDGVKDVGLVDDVGNRAFNPPSLRGVAQRTRFLHDGRAGSLEAVFSEHKHPPGVSLADSELHDLLAHLRTL